jgi:rfaE bifunctional protein nucleotidyltransferase chain/domain
MRAPRIKIVEGLAKEPAPAALPGRITARDKVCSMTELQGIVARYRATGQRVALCHGVFDLVHLGHVRHLEEARGFGDVLVVTLTADAFVNKGPGRPVFAEFQRAEMLAALAYVDHVAINNGPDAEQVIRALQPDFYVKGSDYANADQDVTGKIAVERAAVEAGGGKLVFTDDITFSSSELISRHLDVFDTETRDYLSSVRAEGGLPAIMELLDRIKDYRVLLVGDAIVDEYQYASPMAKAAKENIIATRFHDSEAFAGGVFAAANHVASFCKEVEVVTWLGARDSQEALIRKALKPNVTLTTLTRQGAPTTRKVRFVDPTHLRKLFEVYFINDTPLSPDDQSGFDRLVARRARDFDVVIATDFGHGAIARSTVNELTRSAPFLAVNAQTNSANIGFNLVNKYPRADYVCIDAPEARLATGDKFGELADIISEDLRRQVDCGRIIITDGKRGCVAFQDGRPPKNIPAFAKSVVDTVGAGDAFLAVTAPLVRAGASMNQAGFVGNMVGALKVEIVGHRKSVEKVPLVKALTAILK